MWYRYFLRLKITIWKILLDKFYLIPDLENSEMERLVKKEFLKLEDIDGKEKFELKHTKNSAGIFGVYRVFMPSSKIFSTITAKENRDFIALEQVKGINPDQYKKDFINQVYIFLMQQVELVSMQVLLLIIIVMINYF